MTTVVTIALVSTVVGLGVGIGIFIYLSKRYPRQDPRLVTPRGALSDGDRNIEALRTLRHQGPCFHIVVREDENSVTADMRFRWEVWEAHRKIWMLLRGTEEDSQIGIDLPYTLGNAPTETEAHAAALDWVLAHPRASRYPIAEGGLIL